MYLQFDDKLIDYLMDHGGREVIEPDDVVETVTELRRKDLFDLFHRIGAVILLNKTNRFTLGFTHPGVGGHHQHHVAEVRFTAVVIGQRTVIHHLQQDIEDIRMRFFDLIKQQHRVRMFDNRIGQQPALIETDVSRRGANQTADGMTFHILGHIKPQQFNTQRFRQLHGDFSFPNPGRPGEQEGPNRFMLMSKPGTRHFDGFGKRFNRFILTKDQHFQAVAKVFQRIAIAAGDALLRNTRDARNHGFDIRHIDRFLTLADRHQPRPRARFVDHVNRLIRQMTIVDVFHRQLDRRSHRFSGITHIVVRFILRFQAVDDLHRLFDRRLGHVDFLETTR